ncbi:unnamed protein product [Boreogadus saida]
MEEIRVWVGWAPPCGGSGSRDPALSETRDQQRRHGDGMEVPPTGGGVTATYMRKFRQNVVMGAAASPRDKDLALQDRDLAPPNPD